MADAKRSVMINFEEVILKLRRFAALFKKFENDRLDLIFVPTGKTQNDSSATPAELLQLWLTGFQFPETLFAFSSDGTWHILTSPKKASYLEPVKKQYEKVNIMHRLPGQTDEASLDSIFSKFEKPVVGVLAGITPAGDFAERCLKVLEDKDTIDITFHVSNMMAIRTAKEQEIQKQAAQLACTVMKSQLINKIENVLDSDAVQSHSDIASEALNAQNDATFLEKIQRKYNMNPTDVEIIYSNVQSGGSFNLGIGVQPTDSDLSHDPGSIIVSVCSKYSEICACITRTFILDGSSIHKEAYTFALRTFEFALSRLKVGISFGSFYTEVYNLVVKEKPEYEKNFLRSLGHTIGLEFKDATFTLTSDNGKCVVEDGMVFHLSIGFNKLVADGKEFAVWIADTVQVTSNGASVLTASVSKVLENISYELEEEEEEEKEDEEISKTSRKPVISSELLRDANSVILQDRLRRRNRAGASDISEQEMEKYLTLQQQLRKKKTEEIAKRLKEDGGFGGSAKQKHVVKMNKLRSFPSPDSFAPEIIPHQIYVDMRNEVVMLPINGYHLPFSVSTIKNASFSPEDSNRSYTLRINFQVPGSHTYTSRNEVNPLPEILDENEIFVKEVLFRSTDSKHIQNVFRSIKDLIKQVKQRENDADTAIGLAEQEKLQPNKTGRRIVLKDLMVRPNIHGSRRMIGFLEAHNNGLRYLVNTRERVDHIDISYSNVRHAIFQPCERELIVLLHFHLKFPILVGKRKTLDVQFYCEVGTQIDDLDNRRGRSYNDPDETLEEMRERELKRRLNSDFKQFVTQIQEISAISFDLPYRELMFTGVPSKSNVELLPTANCLVHLVEWPPFVLSLDEIEIVSLERIQHGLRNFDMVLINKDYSKPVKRIDLVPVEYLDIIKRWLSELEIVWYEGKNNLQWTNILKTILEDADTFIENGAFDGFLGESDGEDESMEDEDDEEYAEDDSEAEQEEDSEDNYSDDDESLADEDEEDEEGDEEYDEEEEGLSWDELEERAKKADDRNAYDEDSHRAKKKKR